VLVFGDLERWGGRVAVQMVGALDVGAAAGYRQRGLDFYEKENDGTLDKFARAELRHNPNPRQRNSVVKAKRHSVFH